MNKQIKDDEYQGWLISIHCHQRLLHQIILYNENTQHRTSTIY